MNKYIIFVDYRLYAGTFKGINVTTLRPSKAETFTLKCMAELQANALRMSFENVTVELQKPRVAS